eukprot:1184933-Prorocentrum_minimum.AAC.1
MIGGGAGGDRVQVHSRLASRGDGRLPEGAPPQPQDRLLRSDAGERPVQELRRDHLPPAGPHLAHRQQEVEADGVRSAHAAPPRAVLAALRRSHLPAVRAPTTLHLCHAAPPRAVLAALRRSHLPAVRPPTTLHLCHAAPPLRYICVTLARVPGDAAHVGG